MQSILARLGNAGLSTLISVCILTFTLAVTTVTA
jgi:hypothetical protein